MGLWQSQGLGGARPCKGLLTALPTEGTAAVHGDNKMKQALLREPLKLESAAIREVRPVHISCFSSQSCY